MRAKKLGVVVSIIVVLLLGFSFNAKGAEKMIQKGSKVKFDYTLKVNGEVVDSSTGRQPLEYTQGAKQIIPGLEKQMEGMKVGEEKTITVPPKEAYGEERPEAFREFPKSAFPKDLQLKEGMVLELKTDSGQPLPAVVKKIGKDTVTLNFNHPLAGKTLVFDVKVVDIK